jgi:hypothetical protein
MEELLPPQAGAELAAAIPALQSRCLTPSLGWASELLFALDTESDEEAAAEGVSPTIALAQTFLDGGEFARCAQVLQARGEHENSALGLFLFTYATFQRAERA